MKSKKEMLQEIEELLIKKGVPKKAIMEDITTADGRTKQQLINHHKRLMSVYSSLPTPVLNQEYNILKHEVENANSSGDQK
jgi:hypothetical protein